MFLSVDLNLDSGVRLCGCSRFAPAHDDLEHDETGDGEGAGAGDEGDLMDHTEDAGEQEHDKTGNTLPDAAAAERALVAVSENRGYQTVGLRLPHAVCEPPDSKQSQQEVAVFLRRVPMYHGNQTAQVQHRGNNKKRDLSDPLGEATEQERAGGAKNAETYHGVTDHLDAQGARDICLENIGDYKAVREHRVHAERDDQDELAVKCHEDELGTLLSDLGESGGTGG